jgi:hypothetical protein
MQKVGWGHLKISFSRPIEPEELIFTRKFFDVM